MYIIYKFSPKKLFKSNPLENGLFGNSNYNSHYSSNVFHQLVTFDSLTGNFLKAEFRARNVYTSRNVTNFLGPIISRYKKKHQELTRVVSFDSGFSTPKLFELLDENNTLCAIRTKAYKTFYTLVREITEEMNCLVSKKVTYG